MSQKSSGSKLLAALAIIATGALVLSAAGCAQLGACEGHSDILDSWYCYDDWTEDECDAYDVERVNDASWNFHGGDTCTELGH